MLATNKSFIEDNLENSLQDGTSTPFVAYSIFSKNRKRWMVFLVAFAGWFSTLSSFIYFPAITALADSLDTSVAKINLTVMSYLVVAALAPSFTGDVADRSGRRPVIIAALGVYIAANIGLALQQSYLALLLLRMVQSAGISGVFAIAYGVMADIASPAERGGFVGIVSFGTNTAPALGPLLGGALLTFRGWSSIFWFLSISAGVCLGLIIFTLPESARNIVGNGSISVSGIYKLPFSMNRTTLQRTERENRFRLYFPNPLTCLYRFRDKDTSMLVITLSIFYMTYTCLQAILSTLLVHLYGLSDLQSGLVYLPFGIGCAVAAFGTGRVLDRDYRIVAKFNGFPTDKELAADTTAFPIAKARLRSVAYPVLISILSIIGYRWSLHANAYLAVPLALQFVMDGMLQSCFTIINTLLVDLNCDAPSTVQASCNIVRCLLAGAGLTIIQPLIDLIGLGWCFTALACICTLPVPLLTLQWQKSMYWRTSRMGKADRGIAVAEKREKNDNTTQVKSS